MDAPDRAEWMWKWRARVSAILIKPDGTQTPVWPQGTRWTLEELQALVEGYIEIASHFGHVDMLVNEEGRLKGLPIKAKASLLADTVIVGNALIIRRHEWE